jgi:4-hydroxybenzoate polyprenyltransferase
MLRALLELSRISNLPTVWTNGLAAWTIAHGRWHLSPSLAWLLLGSSMVYSGGMILNDVCDAAWDRQRRPDRPIPSGRIGLGQALTWSLLGLLGGAGIMVFAGCRVDLTLGLLVAIIGYDLYHKPWPGSVVVMGSCRALLYLAAASAVGPLPAMTWLGPAATVLTLYIIGLTLFARSEATGKGDSWSNRLGMGLILAPVTIMHLPHAGYWPTAILLVAFAILAVQAIRQVKQGGAAIGNGVSLLLAGIVLVDGLAMAPYLPWATAVIFVIPILRYWQRWIAAT